MIENKIPEDAAQKQVDILIDYYELDDEKELIKLVRPDLIKHVMRGRIEISMGDNNRLAVRQTFKFPVGESEGLDYKVINGVSKKQMKASSKSDHEKMYSLMGSLAGVSGESISRLEGVDLSAMECLANLFLSV